MNDKFSTDKAPAPVGLYPHSRKLGNILFLSGIGPREAGTNAIPGNEYDAEGKLIKYDIAAQCHSVFKNVKVVLEESGSKWENMVDITVFLTNMKDDFKIYNELYAQYFKDAQPTRTTIEIKSLPTPIAIELKVIASI